MQKQYIRELTRLGLSENEAKTYLALLVKSVLSVGEITNISRVPRPKLYGIIKGLIEKGLCVEKPGSVKSYSAVSPELASERLLQNYHDQLEGKKKSAKKFVESCSGIYIQGRNKYDPLDYIEVLTDVRQIRERWLNIQKNIRNEMFSFTKPPYTSPTMEDNVKAVGELINKQKITNKCIYEYVDLTSEEINNLIRIIELYQEVGEQARIIKELPMKLIICDETITMLALNDRVTLKPSITTMIVNHPNFAKAQKEVFKALWANAISIEDFKKLKKL